MAAMAIRVLKSPPKCELNSFLAFEVFRMGADLYIMERVGIKEKKG